jgi:glycerol-3-phosphate dehydrogenase
VVSVYAGLRPLLAGESDLTSKLSREHTIATPAPGLVVVAGGKYTTYRVMARDAVDAALEGLGGTGLASCTERVPLLGAEGFVALVNQRHTLAALSGLPPARVEHLLRRYGTLAHDLIELIEADPRLGEPIEGAGAYLYAEVAYAVTAEGARHLEDVLTRRTRIYVETADRGTVAAPRVAEVMAGLLGWTGEQAQREVKHYLMQVDAERAAQEQPGDATADAIRLGAPDVIPLEG